jgi:hypothetical protein
MKNIDFAGDSHRKKKKIKEKSKKSCKKIVKDGNIPNEEQNIVISDELCLFDFKISNTNKNKNIKNVRKRKKAKKFGLGMSIPADIIQVLDPISSSYLNSVDNSFDDMQSDFSLETDNAGNASTECDSDFAEVHEVLIESVSEEAKTNKSSDNVSEADSTTGYLGNYSYILY